MPENLTPGDGQDVFARFKRAREQRDPDLMLELFAAEAEYRPDPFEPALVGSNEIRAHWNAVAAEQAHVDFDVERVWVVGRTVLANWHAAFTLRATAERFRSRGFASMELDDDGLIGRAREWSVRRSIGADSKFKPEPSARDTGESDDG